MNTNKKDGEWWESGQNDLDNDIEQLSRTTGGGGCLMRLSGAFVPLTTIVFFLTI